ncbi:hypothetical protein TRFO_23671 [Tritrichomonas foetus]|uniref:Uncharacterized protein n=1 Tax=Tritrichomonas foetus TaxID=1144522 RepID=A0A1J4KF83_9EUKA|nr:hypothetical protein TRFO_23671 [Tritrichomonas foetus]|eukprot:OHT08037.1 hypothetical protein TRFO_23671 [Tritrichomonas foetus]
MIPENEITPQKAMELIRDDRIEASETRMKESLFLLEQASNSIKDSIKKQYDAIYVAKKEEVMHRIIKMYNELMKNSNREIELYLAGAPFEKQELNNLLQNTTPKQTKKRTNARSNSHTPDVSLDAFHEDFQEMLEELKNDGNDMNSEVLLTDGGFLYQGRCYADGDMIHIAKFSNSFINAKIELVTTAQVLISFSDGNTLKISKEDLMKQKIKIAPMAK